MKLLNRLFSRFRANNPLSVSGAGQTEALAVASREVEASAVLALHPQLTAPILIAVHHKAGTNWLASIFRQVCSQHEMRWQEGSSPNSSKNFDVFFQDHSYFSEALLKDHYRGLHLIRDPRDLIVSGCFYHQHSSEEWLHIPRDEFGGLTYQQKINSFASTAEKLLFEMQYNGSDTIRDLLRWNYQNPAFIEVKYEDLIEDTELLLFARIFRFLGIAEALIDDFTRIAFNNSLFSGKVSSEHVRSGKSQQWRQYFDRELAQHFVALFDEALIDLGYEENQSWVTLCPEILEAST